MAALGLRDFSHVSVRASDIERSLAFHGDGLGVRYKHEHPIRRSAGERRPCRGRSA